MLSQVQSSGRVMAVWREPFKLGSPQVDYWPEGLTVSEIVDRMPCLPENFREVGVVTINGTRIPGRMWDKVRPKAHRAEKPVGITLQVRTQGGRGGGGGKSVFRMVAAIALTVVTAGIAGGAAAPLLGASFAAGTIGASLLAAGVSLVGSLILNSLSSTPARGSNTASETSDGGGSTLEGASVQGNVLQPNAALPRVIGTRRIYPPFAFEPISEYIGQDEFVEAVYCLAGPHQISEPRLGQATVVPNDLDGDVLLQIDEGLPGTPVGFTVPQRYGRTFPLNVEMSVHGTDPDDLSLFEPPLPVFHGTCTAEDPDEAWLHMFSQGMVSQNPSDGTLRAIRIPFRIRMRLRGTSTWRYLPEFHYMDATQSQRRIQVKFKFGAAYSEGNLPQPSINRGFIEARSFVPGQDVLPTGPSWTCDSYFNPSGTNVIYNASTFNTTGIQNFTLSADTIEVYLDVADWPKGIYDVEIIRGATFLNSQFNSTNYTVNGDVLDLYGSRETEVLPLSRENLMDRMTLVRMISIKKLRPINQQNIALIRLRARNRSVDSLSVRASGYVNDYVANPAESFDDVPWATYDASANLQWRGLTWSPELKRFVAVAQTGTGNRAMTSPNGTVWTERGTPSDISWYKVVWAKSLGLFVAVALDNVTGNIMISDDGISWVVKNQPAANRLLCVEWSEDLGVLVAGQMSPSTLIARSVDGNTWTHHTSAIADVRDIRWSSEQNQFVAVGNTGDTSCVATSPDGSTWAAQTGISGNWNGVAYSPLLDLYVAVGLSTAGTQNVMTSPDGIAWTGIVTPSTDTMLSVVWIPEINIFVAGGANGTVLTSVDGVNWAVQSSPIANTIFSATWSPRLQMLAFVSNGQTNSVLTKNVYPDGWTQLTVTSNPAAHYRDILSGVLNFDPLPTELHDEQSLIDWHAKCESEGYRCDLIVEGGSLFEVLRIVASCGYARPYQSEVWGVIQDYDRSAESPVQIFTPRNMNNFIWRKAFPRLPAGFRINFRSDEFEYNGRQIVVYRDGASPSDILTEQVTYDGLVEREAVVRRARFDLRQAQYRSAVYSFEAPADAIVCRRGSLIGVNHDTFLRVYGAGRVLGIALNGDDEVIAIEVDSLLEVKNIDDIIDTLDLNSVSNMLDLGINTSIALRTDDGLISIKAISNSPGETTVLEFSEPFENVSIITGGPLVKLGTLFTIGVTGKEFKRLIVSDINPGNNLTSTITAVDEAPQIWSNLDG